MIKRKRLAQSLAANSYVQQDMFLVVGCQRSGTTMMLRILERDAQSRVFGEFSKLSSADPKGIRLNPLPQVQTMLQATPASFIVLKPLVETQNLLELLDYFPQAKALWMYRHYKDVAASNLQRFSTDNGISDIRPIVEQNHRDWRAEKVSAHVRKVISAYFSEDMRPLDAAALFWYARNHIFLDLQLAQHPRVMMCRYADIVTAPRATLQQIYTFVNRPFPENIVNDTISTGSIGKGQTVALHPEIEALCEQMLKKLDQANQHLTQPVLS